MNKIYCEGKYDFIYLNRLIAFYKLNVKVEACNGKAGAIGKFRSDNSEYLMIDYDKGISKENMVMIKKHHDKIIISKIDLENYFWNMKEISKKDKRDLADKFNELEDIQLEKLINDISFYNINFLDELEQKPRCSNIIFLLKALSNV